MEMTSGEWLKLKILSTEMKREEQLKLLKQRRDIKCRKITIP